LRAGAIVEMMTVGMYRGATPSTVIMIGCNDIW
jgi:hypothetical protein